MANRMRSKHRRRSNPRPSPARLDHPVRLASLDTTEKPVSPVTTVTPVWTANRIMPSKHKPARLARLVRPDQLDQPAQLDQPVNLVTPVKTANRAMMEHQAVLDQPVMPDPMEKPVPRDRLVKPVLRALAVLEPRDRKDHRDRLDLRAMTADLERTADPEKPDRLARLVQPAVRDNRVRTAAPERRDPMECQAQTRPIAHAPGVRQPLVDTTSRLPQFQLLQLHRQRPRLHQNTTNVTDIVIVSASCKSGLKLE